MGALAFRLLLAGEPLLLGVEQYAAYGDQLGGRRLLAVVHLLEPARHLLDGEHLKIHERLRHQSDLGILLSDDMQVLLHCLLLVNLAREAERTH